MIKAFLPIVYVVAASALAGCGDKTEVTQNTSSDNAGGNTLPSAEPVGDAQATDMVAPQEDAWTLSDETDAMSDARILKATYKVLGQHNDIEILTTCNPATPSIRYEITGLDKAGNPSAMSHSVYNGVARIVYQIRADMNKAADGFSLSQFNNRIVFQAQTGMAAASAHMLTLRVPFLDAIETYTIDQNSENFRSAVQLCLAERQAKRQRLETYRAEQMAAPATTDQTEPPQEPTNLDPNNTAM